MKTTGTAGTFLSSDAVEYFFSESRLAALGRMSSSVMHDIRNYLTVISSNVQLIQLKSAGIKPDDLNRRLDEMLHQIDLILIAMDRVGHFGARADGDAISTNPDAVVDCVIHALRRKTMRSRVVINRIPSGFTGTVPLDAGLLEFVFLEIVNRFLETTPKEVPISIRSQVTDRSWQTSMTCISRHENGIFNGDDFHYKILGLAVAKLGGTLTVPTDANTSGYIISLPLG